MTRQPSQAGFTMIEVLIAMTLTALAILGIMALYTTNMRASGFTRHQTEASVLAESKIEDIRSLPAASPPVGSPETNIGPLGATTTGIFKRVWTETIGVGNPYADIVVTVSWNDDDPLGHSVIMHARRNLP
ncbi:MAG TPA: prepilin-type N-terminal cleavage/methylation domain-containing protein [Kofleriaceae bacterium]|jgi:prepilin-type N-terminal cleavage/methylation domain-containing protein|nr:prepilin-type N-terminal cleavage/methylation domain-containing protein [Kofleriaceae bacterium]